MARIRPVAPGTLVATRRRKEDRMKTPMFWLLGCLAVAIVGTACGQDAGHDEPATETVGQKLDNGPGGIGPRRQLYLAERTPDGTSYCAKANPKLCAPATELRATKWACRGHKGGACETYGRGECICCEWVPGSWPFQITCWDTWDIP
jgi:hypothetical protein